MRINMPVTNRELEYTEDQIIVSRTDLKGLITYVNRTFLEISGFTEAELIGQPHNLVRHPDMPVEAFKDLWSTLKAGRPWVGYVKNRCKNGDFYWVEAHVTPIRESGSIVGYLSVRKKPARSTIVAVEQLYQKFKANQAGGSMVQLGEVVSSSPLAAMSRKFRDAGLRSKLWLLASAGVATPFALEALGLGINSISAALGIGVFGLIGAEIAAQKLAAGVREANVKLEELASGNYTSAVDVVRNDEFGSVYQRIKSMQIRQGFEVAESRRVYEESLRIQVALDNVATNVMVADIHHNIIYMNQSLRNMFARVAKDLQKDLPQFDPETVIGSNIDIFHKNPSHQRSILGGMTSPQRATILIGGRTFTLTVAPVINDKRERLGTAVEWLDRTEEVAIEQEVSRLVDGAAHGDFSGQISVDGKSGFFLQLANGLNQVMNITAAGLSDVSSVMNALASGDLTRSITRDYDGMFAQLKGDVNSTIEQLRQVVGGIKESADLINTAAGEIAAGNSDLSSRTEEQASSLEQTAASMEELNATVQQNAANARQAMGVAESSNEVAERSGLMVRQIVDTMSGIQESSRKISDIIGVIDSIAFQTNILALNAAVEAARAGEQGRGFAVVASEVRSLAQRSAQAAKEIKTLIATSVDEVESGARLVNEAGETMEKVVSNFHQLARLVTDIANASREQSAGIEQVTQAVGQMDEVTQQNAALVEEAAAAAESLEDQVRELTRAVGVFTLSASMARGSSITSLSSKPQPVARKAATPIAKSPKVAPPTPKAPSAPKAKMVDDEDDWAEF